MLLKPIATLQSTTYALDPALGLQTMTLLSFLYLSNHSRCSGHQQQVKFSEILELQSSSTQEVVSEPSFLLFYLVFINVFLSITRKRPIPFLFSFPSSLSSSFSLLFRSTSFLLVIFFQT
jgi:hypothetical protein